MKPWASGPQKPPSLALRGKEIAGRRHAERIESRLKEPSKMLAIQGQEHIGPARRREQHRSVLARRKNRWIIKTGEISHYQEPLSQGRPFLGCNRWKTVKVRGNFSQDVVASL